MTATDLRPRFPAIEGLRAFAALGIVVFHVGELGGTEGQLADIGQRLTVGVPVFFVVSAFVLYRPFVASRAAGGSTPPIGSFLLRRAARVVPLYWITLTVVWATSPLFSATTRTEFFAGLPWWRYYLFTQVYDEASLGVGALGPAWSLNVEVVFYLLLPLWAVAFAWLARRRVPAHVELACLGALAVGGMALLQRLEDTDSYLARTPPPNVGFFAIGMALAILSVDLAAANQPMLLSRTVRRLAPLAPYALAAILATFFLAPEIPRFDLVRTALVSIVLVPAVFDRRSGTVTTRILEQRHIRTLGIVSYAVYLFHRQIALGLRLWFWDPMNKYDFLVAFGAVLAVTVVLANASYRHLEHPIIRAARGFGRPATARPDRSASESDV